jgi:hypothetical protein
MIEALLETFHPVTCIKQKQWQRKNSRYPEGDVTGKHAACNGYDAGFHFT